MKKPYKKVISGLPALSMCMGAAFPAYAENEGASDIYAEYNSRFSEENTVSDELSEMTDLEYGGITEGFFDTSDNGNAYENDLISPDSVTEKSMSFTKKRDQ